MARPWRICTIKKGNVHLHTVYPKGLFSKFLSEPEIFNSTSKHFGERNQSKYLEKPSGKKLRPSSAQNISSGDVYNDNFNSPASPNEDLSTPVKPINELPEEPNTSRVSRSTLILEESKAPMKVTVKNNSIDEYYQQQQPPSANESPDGKVLEPVYRENGKNFE